MPATLLLWFSAETRSLYRMRRSGPQLEKHFSNDHDALAAFREFLGKRRGALLHVVVDLAGEDFHDEQIPLLRGAERKIVIERRLAQRYREARFAAAIPLGRTTDARRQERLVLASFPQTGSFAEWLQAVDDAPVALAGVCTTGLIAPGLASRLGIRRGTLFLLTVDHAGLRQSFLENGRLRLSRLTPVPADGISAAFVRREAVQMLQFLESSRTLPREMGALPVLLVVADPAPFEAALDDERLAFTTIGIREAATKCGLRDAPDHAAADSLYAHLAVRNRPAGQFLRGKDRRSLRAFRLRRTLLPVGVSALAACAAYSVSLSLEDRAVRTEIASLRQELVQLRDEERRLQAELPPTPARTETIKAAALEFRRIAAHAAGPEAALLHLSRALDQAPEIELEALSWESKDAPAQALEIHGRVSLAQHADLREVGRQIERFANLLSSAPGWRVAGTRLPFDAAPNNALAGDFGNRDAGERTRFSLNLVKAP